MFNQLGWLTSESGSGSGVTSASRSFGYDLAGYRTSASHPSGTIGFDYDDRGLLIETTGPAGSATFAYDPAGYMTQRVDAAGTTGFTWTDRGELETLSDPVTGITISYAWDDASQLNTVTYGATSPPKRTLTWDDLGRLDTDTHRVSRDRPAPGAAVPRAPDGWHLAWHLGLMGAARGSCTRYPGASRPAP